MTPDHRLVVLDNGTNHVAITCPGSSQPLDHGCCPYCQKEFDHDE